MSDKTAQATQILQRYYNIDGVPDDIYETFDDTAVKKYQKFPNDYTVHNYGYFEKQRFRVEDTKYNLVFCKSNFAGNEALFSSMKNSETITVQSYEFVEQVEYVKDWYLYKLIPYTVQGVPDW